MAVSVTGCGFLTNLTPTIDPAVFGQTTSPPRWSFNSVIVDAVDYVAVDYVFERARQLGKPAVVNLSTGTVSVGPHDDSTTYERMLGALTGPGRILVIASGNDGGTGVHASGSVTAGGTATVPWVVGPSGAGATFNLVDMWYAGSDQVCISVTDPNNNTLGPYGPGCQPPPCSSTGATFPGGSGVTLELCMGQDPSSLDNEAVIQIKNQTRIAAKTYTIRVAEHGRERSFRSVEPQPAQRKLQLS